MYVYQSETGLWILFDGVEKWFFDTEMEARIMARKLDFAQGIVNYCTAMAQNADFGINARTVFNDRGYNPGGSDPILDEDVAPLGITAAQLLLGVVFFENLEKMLEGQAITVADYDKTLNLLRNDV